MLIILYNLPFVSRKWHACSVLGSRLGRSLMLHLQCNFYTCKAADSSLVLHLLCSSWRRSRRFPHVICAVQLSSAKQPTAESHCVCAGHFSIVQRPSIHSGFVCCPLPQCEEANSSLLLSALCTTPVSSVMLCVMFITKHANRLLILCCKQLHHQGADDYCFVG